ncbi:hypothetical protein [Clostridium sp. VAP23]|uniref:hypothetical protein n=1 Tax=Clostridium sp. VAP23 TaxID=2949981 RepID=UPI0020799A51|nr:hypothetical protein [Clostridium sp. VAP23]
MEKIDPTNFNVKIGMYKTCSLIQGKKDYTKIKEFKYKELDNCFKEAFIDSDKILISFPFSALKRRLSQIKKAGYKILQTSVNDNTNEADIVNLVVEK